MKNEYHAAEQYLASQDRDMLRKLRLVKDHSLLLKNTLDILDWEREKCAFIINNFQRLAIQLPLASAPTEFTEEIREWPFLSTFKNAAWPKSQQQMEAVCQSIEQLAHGVTHKQYYDPVVIDFERGVLNSSGKEYPLDDAVIEVDVDTSNPSATKLECFNLRRGNRLRATIYMCKIADYAQAYLKATDDDGKTYFFTLKQFSMLHLLREHYRAFDEKARVFKGSGAYCKPLEADTGKIIGTGAIDAEGDTKDAASSSTETGRRTYMFITFSGDGGWLYDTEC